MAYLFDISYVGCSLLSLFAAVRGKIKEVRRGFEMNFLQIRSAEVESGNKIIQTSNHILFFTRQVCL